MYDQPKTEKNVKKNIYIYVKLSPFAVHLKLTQHCELTILQLKKKQKSIIIINY